jgi:integrase/recombinase XerD
VWKKLPRTDFEGLWGRIFLRNPGDLFSLKKILGHETLEMVRHYVDISADMAAKAHKIANPVDNLRSG